MCSNQSRAVSCGQFVLSPPGVQEHTHIIKVVAMAACRCSSSSSRHRLSLQLPPPFLLLVLLLAAAMAATGARAAWVDYPSGVPCGETIPVEQCDPGDAAANSACMDVCHYGGCRRGGECVSLGFGRGRGCHCKC